MPCGLGFPSKPCPFDHKGQVTRASCGACKHFVVPKHIERHCTLWDRDRVLCLKPKSACTTCPEFCVQTKGRPVSSAHDRRTAEGERAYQAEYRAANPDKVAEQRAAFKRNHPTYWKDYYARNRATINAKRRKKREGQ